MINENDAGLSHAFFKETLFTNVEAVNDLNIEIEEPFLKSESGKFNTYLTRK